MPRELHGRSWVIGKYVLLQIPGWILVGGLLALGVRWWGLSHRLALALFALWLLKDAVLFPFLRVAYEPGGGGGADALIGARGVASQSLDPRGYVRVGAELWRAEVTDGARPIPRGGGVRVRQVRGLTLLVEPEAGEET
jgi:membrane protein implicated in regulation of membrane protease activity